MHGVGTYQKRPVEGMVEGLAAGEHRIAHLGSLHIGQALRDTLDDDIGRRRRRRALAHLVGCLHVTHVKSTSPRRACLFFILRTCEHGHQLTLGGAGRGERVNERPINE